MSINNHFLKFKKGEQIFNVGDAADCAYIIDYGTVGLYSSTIEDECIAILEKGDILGEMGIINDSNRSVSAFAKTDIELLIIDRDQITSRLQKADPIIHGLMEVLLSRIRGLLNDRSTNKASIISDNLIVTEGLHKIRFERELFQALEKDEIVNVYQPMVNLKHGYIAGFEALSRWNHPEKGMVSPFEFISLAEESDFIIPMGIKIFASACKQLAKFQNQRNKTNSNLPELFMSINVSAAQLSAENFLTKIKSITNKYQIDPNNIKIEITESLVVDYENVLKWIGECNEYGFKLSLDDFGTGYSGFQHLLELDFHTIKIDQAFIKSIDKNPKSMIMLEVISDMAKRMNMSIVAEGIEDLESANFLSDIGVDYGQGYYFYRPMSATKILEILR